MAALLGMLLLVPAMFSGLMGDDFLHWSLLTGHGSHPQPGSVFGLFTFADGNRAHNQAMMDNGQLIWWAKDTVRISFWRPLAELSQWLDYQLWPGSPVLMHFHSLVLYGIIILLVGKLFTELEPNRRVAHLATLIFALSMLHVFAVAWLASRNQMLSTLFMLLAVLAYHRWRQQGSLAYACGAALALVLGLFSAEAAVETVGYFVAYAAFMEQDKPLWQRVRAVAPYLLIVLVWKVVHSHLGYGSFGSPGYIDPVPDLGRFSVMVAVRMPALMLAQWYGASAVGFMQLDSDAQVIYSAVATALLLLLAYVVYWLGAFKSALIRFYTLGALLSLLPACAGYPFDRLTLNSDVAVSGILACLAFTVYARREQLAGWAAGSAKYLIYALTAIHLVVFPIVKVTSSLALSVMAKPTLELVHLVLPDASGDPAERWVLINMPAAESVYYVPLTRAYFGRRNPPATYALGPDNQAVTLTRVSDDTLRLSAAKGYQSIIARDAQRFPFKVGDTASMGGIQIKVEEVSKDHFPKTALFHFPTSLQDKKWRFFAWKQSGCVPVQVPDVGQSVTFAAVDIGQAVKDYFYKK